MQRRQRVRPGGRDRRQHLRSAAPRRAQRLDQAFECRLVGRGRREADAAACRSGVVVTVHRHRCAIDCPGQRGVGGARDQLVDGLALLGAELAEDVRGRLARRGLADADAQARNVDRCPGWQRPSACRCGCRGCRARAVAARRTAGPCRRTRPGTGPASIPSRSSRARTAVPLRFMNVWGLASTTCQVVWGSSDCHQALEVVLGDRASAAPYRCASARHSGSRGCGACPRTRAQGCPARRSAASFAGRASPASGVASSAVVRKQPHAETRNTRAYGRGSRRLSTRCDRESPRPGS